MFHWIYLLPQCILNLHRRSEMKRIKAGINGMGRIGRNLTRVITEKFGERIQIVAVNDLFPAKDIVRALRRDSVYGAFPATLELRGSDRFAIDGHEVQVCAEKSAQNIPWGTWGVDLVFECSGFYLTREKAEAHLQAGAKKVVMSAPPKDDTPIFVIGVNDEQLEPEEHIISNASCTTNCYAPIIKALDDEFGVVSGLMATTHAATNGQHAVDAVGNERARSVFGNIIPTGTGAAKAVGKVLKHLEGHLNGTSLRVPVQSGSVVEAVTVIRGTHGVAEVLDGLRKRAVDMNARSLLGTVLYVGEDYQVSADALGSPWSSMVITRNAMAVPNGNDTLLKLTSFYDNEMGYSHRLAELGILAASRT